MKEITLTKDQIEYVLKQAVTLGLNNIDSLTIALDTVTEPIVEPAKRTRIDFIDTSVFSGNFPAPLNAKGNTRRITVELFFRSKKLYTQGPVNFVENPEHKDSTYVYDWYSSVNNSNPYEIIQGVTSGLQKLPEFNSDDVIEMYLRIHLKGFISILYRLDKQGAIIAQGDFLVPRLSTMMSGHTFNGKPWTFPRSKQGRPTKTQ